MLVLVVPISDNSGSQIKEFSLKTHKPLGYLHPLLPVICRCQICFLSYHFFSHCFSLILFLFHLLPRGHILFTYFSIFFPPRLWGAKIEKETGWGTKYEGKWRYIILLMQSEDFKFTSPSKLILKSSNFSHIHSVLAQETKHRWTPASLFGFIFMEGGRDP